MFRVFLFFTLLFLCGYGNASYAYEEYEDSIELRFDEKDINVAMFKRAGFWWVVFDNKPEHTNLEYFEKEEEIYHVDDDDNYIIYFSLPENIYPRVELLHNTRYVITFVGNKLAGDFYADPEIIAHDSEHHITHIPGVENNMIIIQDPNVGDELWVFPTKYNGRAWHIDNHMMYFECLQTYIGLVIKPLSEDLEVKETSHGINVGIHLPEENYSENKNDELINDLSDSAIMFNFVSWGSDKNLYSELARFNKLIITSHPSKRIEYRFNIVQLYLAHKMYPEARGYLDYMLSLDSKISNSLRYRLLYAITLYFNKQYKIAFKLFQEDIDDGMISKRHINEFNFLERCNEN